MHDYIFRQSPTQESSGHCAFNPFFPQWMTTNSWNSPSITSGDLDVFMAGVEARFTCDIPARNHNVTGKLLQQTTQNTYRKTDITRYVSARYVYFITKPARSG